MQEYKEKRKIELAEELKFIEVEHSSKMAELKQKEDLLVQEHNKENGTKFTHIDEVIEAHEIKVRAVSDILDDFYGKNNFKLKLVGSKKSKGINLLSMNTDEL